MIVYTIIILMLLQVITTFEMMIIMPLAPVIALNYSIESATVTLLSLGYAFSGLLTPFFGYIADKFSMKNMIVFSTFVFGIGAYVVSVNTIVSFVLGRFILGIGYFNLTSIIMSYTPIIIRESKLGFIAGLYKIAFAFGAFLSPIISGKLIHVLHFTSIYFYLFTISIIMVFLLLVIPNASVSDSNDPIELKSVISIVKDRKAQLMILSVFLISIPSIYFYNFASINLIEIGHTQDYISSYYSIVAAGSIVAGFLISLISDRFGKENMTLLSIFITIIAFTGILLNPTGLVIGFLFGVAYDTIWGLIFPVCTGYYKTMSATFLTILSSAMSFTNIVTNSTAPFLYNIGGFKLLVSICTIGIIISLVLVKRSFRLLEEESNYVSK